jgi:hypothetical protein
MSVIRSASFKGGLQERPDGEGESARAEKASPEGHWAFDRSAEMGLWVFFLNLLLMFEKAWGVLVCAPSSNCKTEGFGFR